jgi:methyl-accepting chemotaxis protein
MTKNAAEIGAIAIKAAEPFTKPLIDKTVEAGGEALSKMGEAGVKVILNTAEEIPVLGVAIGTIRSLSNIGEAIVSSVNAGSEVVSSASDTINASVKNFDRLIQEKQQIMNRTQASVNEFSGGSFTRKYNKYIKYKKNNKTKKI